ncbi:MAG: OmpH family outer membrane protein [Planctomycetes bacterium]|nr:OmpH family outer membrane protein [Planctomycetota bacterium]
MTSILLRSVALCSVLLLGAAGASVSGNTENARTATKPNYRFVNLNKALEGWDYAKKLQVEFKSDFDQRTDALQGRQKMLQQKNDELTTLSAGGSTDDTRRREREIALEASALKYDLEVFKKEKYERRLRILVSEYQQIQSIAGKWAEKNGIDAVFVVQDEDSTIDDDLNGKYERAVVRQVLWYSKDLDVTDDVLKLLQATVTQPANAASKPANGKSASNTNNTQGNK